MNWFSKSNQKGNCSFIQLDIKEFYPSITKTIFNDALNFAKMHTKIGRDEIRIIKHCRKSLLFSGNEAWVKKNSSNCFDVTMGSHDGAEICELVGLFILDTLSKKLNKNDIGLYRDDGLIVLKDKNGHELDKIRKQIIQDFKAIGFQIDININLKIIDFLDVTFNLLENLYKPYKKLNSKIVYINTDFNHSPEVIKHIHIFLLTKG